jgi:peptide chain release factor 2
LAAPGGLFDVGRLERELQDVRAQMEDPAVWQNSKRAQELGKKQSRLQSTLERFNRLKRVCDDDLEMASLAESEGDLSLVEDLTESVKKLGAEARELELETLLSGPYDSHDAILTLHSGAGGTEAMDWVEMLYRMYNRWAERRGFRTEMLDSLPGEEAGLKNVSFSVKGDYAYGFLRTERGVHRLVRISPFDSNARRHTSFASLDVLPDIEENSDVQWNPDDVKMDRFHSSGAGGQNVNKVETGVRLTHLPTGIVVTCQNERSQHANRILAERLLAAKLLALKEEEHRKEIESLRGVQRDIAWGSQIRSYVFQPYTLVKDHRTQTEVGSVDRVMDGAIDDFIYAKLQQDALAAAGVEIKREKPAADDEV